MDCSNYRRVNTRHRDAKVSGEGRCGGAAEGGGGGLRCGGIGHVAGRARENRANAKGTRSALRAWWVLLADYESSDMI